VAGRSTRSLDVVMGATRKIDCPIHGKQDESFVCSHIVESLHTGIPVGFHWSREDNSRHPDAWCSACETARVETGGNWNNHLMDEVLKAQLLCGACYEHAKGIWTNGRKMTQ
jgi:hypothetical protein